jgi:hypothetical protein
MRVAIIGQGYVGLTIASFASDVHDVVGFDLNPSIVSQLNAGVSHIEGVSSGLLKGTVDSGRYRATTTASDIADAAFEEMKDLSFTGFSVRYIASDQRTWSEIASVLGTAIGKPELPYVEFTDEQSRQGMTQMGLPPTVVEGYVAMGHALRTGAMETDFKANPPATWGKVKLEDFAKAFTGAFQSA